MRCSSGHSINPVSKYSIAGFVLPPRRGDFFSSGLRKNYSCTRLKKACQSEAAASKDRRRTRWGTLRI